MVRRRVLVLVAATRFVLGERSAALSTRRERAHQLLICLLVPGFQFELLARVVLRVIVLAALRIICGQLTQRAQNLLTDLLALEQTPFFKRRTIAGESVEETAAIVETGDGRLETLS